MKTTVIFTHAFIDSCNSLDSKDLTTIQTMLQKIFRTDMPNYEYRNDSIYFYNDLWKWKEIFSLRPVVKNEATVLGPETTSLFVPQELKIKSIEDLYKLLSDSNFNYKKSSLCNRQTLSSTKKFTSILARLGGGSGAITGAFLGFIGLAYVIYSTNPVAQVR